MLKAAITLLLLAVISAPINAGDQWIWDGYFSSITLKREKAFKEGVDDDAYSLGTSVSYANDNLNWVMLTGGLELLFYEDNDAFTQVVEEPDGDRKSESSDANGVMAYLEFGPRLVLGKRQSTFLTARAGVSSIFESSRSISNCSNCYEEDIDLNGGYYIQLGAAHSAAGVSVGVYFNRYLNEDSGIENSLRLSIGTGF